MTETYTFQMSKRDHDTYTVDVMSMYVNGKKVDQRDVVNIHETFAERTSKVRRSMIAHYENYGASL